MSDFKLQFEKPGDSSSLDPPLQDFESEIPGYVFHEHVCIYSGGRTLRIYPELSGIPRDNLLFVPAALLVRLLDRDIRWAVYRKIEHA